MAKMQIIILTEVPLSKRDYDRFGIEILSRNFDVFVLDCTPWLKPRFWETYAEIRHEFPGYSMINDWTEFKNHLSDISESIAVDYLGDCPISQRIRHELRSRKILRAIVRCGLIPEPTGPEKLKAKLHQGHLLRKALSKLYREIRWIVRPASPLADIAVVSGEAALKIKCVQVAHQIWAHSFDYESYLKCLKKGGEETGRYALFLDSDFVFHPEWLAAGIKPVVSVEKYYPSLNYFFDRFEEVTGLPVVIAAHPRSRYDLRPQLYAHRVPVLGQTPELVRDATMVLTTHSTAVSYAVLWEKPIVCICTDEYENSNYSIYAHENSSLLHTPLINVDSFEEADIDPALLMSVDRAAYARYKRMYIKRPGTPELSIWKIFSNYVRENLSHEQKQVEECLPD
jgi:hypothetical protein